MGLTRRHFMQLGGLSLLAGACARPGLPGEPPALRAFAAADADEPLLVAIFLRGGADGLHLVPAIGDPAYARMRGRLALRETLAFAPGFGLHPELAPLGPLVERGDLAVVHAAGSPHRTRSHFEAQDFMEAGSPGTTRPADGWLARGLAGATSEDPFAALAIGSNLPLSLRGSGSFAMGEVAAFGIPGASRDARDALVELYAAAESDPVARAGSAALVALDSFEARLGAGGGRARRGSRAAGLRIAQAVEQLLRLERAGLALQAVCLESGGWDTHLNQGAESGQLAGWVRDLAEGLAALELGLAGRRPWRAVVMTEFGRSVRPNGSRGSDHGHGSALLLAGAGVHGGLHADWRGLEERELFEGRDLPVTTDWRSVLSELLTAHLGRRPPADTFPGFEPQTLSLFG